MTVQYYMYHTVETELITELSPHPQCHAYSRYFGTLFSHALSCSSPTSSERSKTEANRCKMKHPSWDSNYLATNSDEWPADVDLILHPAHSIRLNIRSKSPRCVCSPSSCSPCARVPSPPPCVQQSTPICW
jgi:hypothetical protein